MNSIKKTPFFINLLGWLISLFAFSLGFWHTHLGLREFKALSSNNGSIIISAIILLLLIVAYYRAVRGMKIALLFYGLCALFFFTFNINSFYPTYLGRKLIKEETISIKNNLDDLKSRINKEFGKEEVNKKYNKVNDLRVLIKQEISKQSGFGPRAKDYLQQINDILGAPYIKPNIRVGNSKEEWDTIASEYDNLIAEKIKSFTAENVGTGQSEVLAEINDIADTYTPQLEKIITDNSKVDIDSIRSNLQIKKMQEVVTKMDKISTEANKLVNEENRTSQYFAKYGEVKSQNLGTFAHTISSVFERIKKIDTWGIIILCLFIDFIVPIAIYFLIRRKDDNNYESEYDDLPTWFIRLFKKNGPKKF